MSYYDNLLNPSTEGCYISASATNYDDFVTRWWVEKKSCAAVFYAIPGFLAVLKVPKI